MEVSTSVYQIAPPLPPKQSARSKPTSLISINTDANDSSISLPHQITSKTSSTPSSTLTQVVQVSSNTASPTLPQTNGNINIIKTTSSNAGATVFVESRRLLNNNTNSEESSTIDQQSLTNNHVVKILINQTKSQSNNKNNTSIVTLTTDDQQTEEQINNNYNKSFNNSVLINVNNHLEDEEMIKNTTMKSTDLTAFQNKSSLVQKESNTNGQGNPYFFHTGFQCSPTNLIMSSGQCSPSDTLDSGTCSDLDMTPPPLPKKKNSKTTMSSTMLVTAAPKKNGTDSSAEECEDTESNVSCDSLNSSDLIIMNNKNSFIESSNQTILPRNLLQDIREHRNNMKNVNESNGRDEVTTKLSSSSPPPIVTSALEKSSSTSSTKVLINESTYEERKKQKQDELNSVASTNVISGNYLYENDRFYKFHLNETVSPTSDVSVNSVQSSTDGADEDECFAGYKDLLGGEIPSTIRSAKGTVRGVKNRVRAGIATFLQIQQTTAKSYQEKDAGKVVIYSTTMGIVRKTYHQCLKVKQILHTHMVKFEERDVFMSTEYQAEIRDRMQSEHILIPQVFVDGQHIGDAETIERLNESGELRRILKPYKSADACTTCQVCGGYRLLPCPVCNGSKKSVHRNHFTTEIVALKCMNCDEVGLVRCYSC